MYGCCPPQGATGHTTGCGPCPGQLSQRLNGEASILGCGRATTKPTHDPKERQEDCVELVQEGAELCGPLWEAGLKAQDSSWTASSLRAHVRMVHVLFIS